MISVVTSKWMISIDDQHSLIATDILFFMYRLLVKILNYPIQIHYTCNLISPILMVINCTIDWNCPINSAINNRLTNVNMLRVVPRAKKLVTFKPEI